MKAKTILVLAAILTVGLAAIFWRKPAAAPAPVQVSESAGREAPDSVQGSGQPGHPPTPHLRHRPVSTPGSAPTDEAVVAQLLVEIQQAFASTDPEAREFALTNQLPALVLKEPAAAARLAEAITDDDLRELALHEVARLWAARDSAAALAWAAALTSSNERDTALTDVCQQVARSDPAAAVRMRERFVLDDGPNPVLAGLAQQWAEKDLPAALAWTLARPQSEQRQGLIAHLAFVQAQTEPAEAVRLIVEQMPPGEAQAEAAISVLHQWGLRDFAAASAWAEHFPESPLRDRALLELSGIASYRQQSNAH